MTNDTELELEFCTHDLDSEKDFGRYIHLRKKSLGLNLNQAPFVWDQEYLEKAIRIKKFGE